MHAAQHTHGSTPPVIHTPLWNSTNVRWQGGGEDQGGGCLLQAYHGSEPWLTTKALRQDYTKPPLEPQSRAWGTKPHISAVLVAMRCILLGGLGRQATDLSEVADHALAGDHTCSAR